MTIRADRALAMRFEIGDIISNFNWSEGTTASHPSCGEYVITQLIISGVPMIQGYVVQQLKSLTCRHGTPCHGWIYDPNAMEYKIYLDKRNNENDIVFHGKMKKHDVWFTQIPDSEPVEFVLYSNTMKLCVLDSKELNAAFDEAKKKIDEIQSISQSFGNLDNFKKATFTLTSEIIPPHIIREKWHWSHDEARWQETLAGTGVYHRG